MRSSIFVLGILLATTSVASIPSASAAGTCDAIRDGGACAGLVCYGETCVPDHVSELCKYMGSDVEPLCVLDGTVLCRGTDLCAILEG